MNVSTDPATIRAVLNEIDRCEANHRIATTALEHARRNRLEATARLTAILKAIGEKSIIVDGRRWSVTRAGTPTSSPVHVIPPAEEPTPYPPTPPQTRARARVTSRKRTRSSKPE